MIKLEHLSQAYGKEKLYENFNLSFEDREITGICGASGVGKSTLLKLCAGLLTPDSGCVTGVKPDQLSVVFQEDRLLPWYSVRQNLEFVLKDKNAENIEAVLALVGLSAVADTMPEALSGGMRKRVAIARAFCYPAEVVLMDEPFTGLDDILKQRIIQDLKKLWQREKRTIIMVSHDTDALERFCSRIIRLAGRPIQVVEDHQRKASGR